MVAGSERIVNVGRAQEMAKIAQAECSGKPWYVARRFNTRNYKDTEYLHGDGIWRNSTLYNNRYSGLFQNAAEVEMAIANFEKREDGGQPTTIPNTDVAVNLGNLQRMISQEENRKRKGHYSGEDDEKS